jgi:hypothetical protein
MMDTKKAQEWWSDRSPLLKKYLQVTYFPATNWQYLDVSQILTIYQNEQENSLRN